MQAHEAELARLKLKQAEHDACQCKVDADYYRHKFVVLGMAIKPFVIDDLASMIRSYCCVKPYRLQDISAISNLMWIYPLLTNQNKEFQPFAIHTDLDGTQLWCGMCGEPIQDFEHQHLLFWYHPRALFCNEFGKGHHTISTLRAHHTCCIEHGLWIGSGTALTGTIDTKVNTTTANANDSKFETNGLRMIRGDVKKIQTVFPCNGEEGLQAVPNSNLKLLAGSQSEHSYQSSFRCVKCNTDYFAACNCGDRERTCDSCGFSGHDRDECQPNGDGCQPKKCTHCFRKDHQTHECEEEYCKHCGLQDHFTSECAEEVCKHCHYPNHFSDNCNDLFPNQVYECQFCGSEDHWYHHCDEVQCARCNSSWHYTNECTASFRS